MEFILASNNAAKLRELRDILEDLGIHVLSQQEAGCNFEVEETGETFAENAYLKAAAVTRATGKPAVADDSGLVVEALGGEPGVYSARYSGSHDHTDAHRCAYLLEKMAGKENRRAWFVSSVCCTFPNGDILRAEGRCAGEILTACRGTGGFGYDPLFLVEGTGKTMAEMTPEEKNAVSHRGRALRKLKAELEAYTQGQYRGERSENDGTDQ